MYMNIKAQPYFVISIQIEFSTYLLLIFIKFITFIFHYHLFQIFQFVHTFDTAAVDVAIDVLQIMRLYKNV